MCTATLATLALAATMLAACQRPDVWDQPGVNEAQFHRDNLECQVIGRGAVGDQFAMGTTSFVLIAAAVHQQNVRDAYRECMMGKSYREAK